MNRRDTIKTLFIGSLGAMYIAQSCNNKKVVKNNFLNYGRTKDEMLHDEKILNQIYLKEKEITTISILCDIILPSSNNFGGASQAKVNEFIDFMVKEVIEFQERVTDGLNWLDNYAKTNFKNDFTNCSEAERIKIVDAIAYPVEENSELNKGVKFFEFMRNLTLTGYYTTEMGIKELGYLGNVPNVWDGVPEDVLKEHNMEYEKEWLAKCVNQEKRFEVAKWDDEGNLING